MQKLFTLSEMAEHLRSTPKTFARHVRDLGIPHIIYGKRMLFAPVAVEAYLAARTPDPANVVKFKPVVRKNRTTQKSRFAEACGL